MSGKDNWVLDLDLINGTEFLRFKMDTELERWKRLLCEWKDFHTDYGSLYVANMSANPAGGMQSRPSIAGGGGNSLVGKESEMVRGSAVTVSTGVAAANSKGFLGLGGGGRKEADVHSAQRDQDDMRNMQLDNDDDADDEEKGVRPLMKVLLHCSSGPLFI